MAAGGGTDADPPVRPNRLKQQCANLNDSKFWKSHELTQNPGRRSGQRGGQSAVRHHHVKAAPASLFMVEKYLRASELVSVRR